MTAIPLPGSGCFEANFPNATSWTEVECGPPPITPNPLALVRRPAINVGDGNDYFATGTGKISSATGSFDSATGITAVYSPIFQDKSKTAYSDIYTLQLNTNKFPTSATAACAASGARCNGWQQFLLSQHSACGKACIYIQYWLFDSPSCPSDGRLGRGCSCPLLWTSSYDQSGHTNSGCWQNSPTNSMFPAPPAIADLGNLKLIGAANSVGTDAVTLQTAPGHLYAQGNPGGTLNLAQG
jgi:hypothetical protein